MKLNSFFACLLGAAAVMPINAWGADVDPLAAVKPLSSFNPINPLMLCADPTAVEYDGRLYVYGSNDHQEYEGNDMSGNNTYGKIKSLVVMSTADMVNWTHHGIIDMTSVCGNWMGNSWAPSIVSRVEDDGLTHFYMYFSNGGGGVGVISSTSPVGPWESPLNYTLVTHATPGLGPCCWPFDPGAVVDENGTGWLTLGGGEPQSDGSSLHPNNAHIVRLGQDMVSLDGDFAHIDAPYQFEASELNIIGGKFVYTYCSSWSDRNAWSQYGASGAAPSTCSMCYMVSDDPLNSDSWTWGADYFKNPGSFGYPWGNNHTHLQKFNDKYYLFYHTQVMEQLAGISGGYRSIAVDEAQVDENTQTIQPVTATNSGPSQIKANQPNALERQQAETFYNAVGMQIAKTSTPGNTTLYKFEPGAWIAVYKVNFGDETPSSFTARLKGKGSMSVIADRLQSTPLCVLNFSSSTYQDQTVKLDQEITGSHTLYFLFTEANTATRFDEWQFNLDDPEGIADINTNPEVVERAYYNMAGVKVQNPANGIYISRSTYSDGSIKTQKIVR